MFQRLILQNLVEFKNPVYASTHALPDRKAKHKGRQGFMLVRFANKIYPETVPSCLAMVSILDFAQFH